MSKYKIGITEAGDAGIDLSWVEKMPDVNGAIVITKRITPAFMDAVIKNKDKLIVHATITGYGGGVLEPNVPSPSFEFAAVKALISHGFPKEKIVIRVDPVIPTNKGLAVAYRRVLKTGMEAGFPRYRISVIDMFAHARKRFADAGLPLPYGEHTFAGKEQMRCVDSMIRTAKAYWEGMGYTSNRGLRRVQNHICWSLFRVVAFQHMIYNYLDWTPMMPMKQGFSERIAFAIREKQSC